ncbi:MAG: type II CAAX endopeptidase family protein [Candidatus Omnitrophota bacterium]
MNNISISDDYPLWNVKNVVYVFIVSQLAAVLIVYTLIKILSLDTHSLFFSIVATITHLSSLVIFTIHDVSIKTKEVSKQLRLIKPNSFKVFYFVLIGFALWLISLFIPESWSAEPYALTIIKQSTSSGIFVFSIIALKNIFVIPFFEEIFWRGYAYPAFAQKIGRLYAILLISLFFTLYHLAGLWGAWSSITTVYIISVILTALRARTNSTIVGIIVHSAYNFFITILVAISMFAKTTH